MIICRTPFRISFFGGGTDYPSWYRSHGGAVLAATIDKYCYLTCRHLPPFFEHRIRVVYRKIETCHTADEVRHPVVREALKHLDFQDGLELHHDGDLPARSGMGSSSAFTVGLLHALHALRGERRTRMQLARESIHVEQELVRETVGAQDQVMAAFGGFQHVQFYPDDRITVDPLPLPPGRVAELNAHLMLFYTGLARTASEIADSYAADLEARRRPLETMRRLVDEGADLLVSGLDIRGFGELLHEGWQAKRGLSDRVSTPRVDELYERARGAGAIGGKLTGAGGGGFLLLFVPPAQQPAVRAALDGLLHVPFTFESAGSQIIFYEPWVDHQATGAARPYRTAISHQPSAISQTEVTPSTSG
jgi:D-glycero-alpha-D-manno-heptose-7-phosphate kinase